MVLVPLLMTGRRSLRCRFALVGVGDVAGGHGSRMPGWVLARWVWVCWPELR